VALTRVTGRAGGAERHALQKNRLEPTSFPPIVIGAGRVDIAAGPDDGLDITGIPSEAAATPALMPQFVLLRTASLSVKRLERC